MITTGGEGKVPPRKRLRGKIGNPSSAPELKTHNLLRNDVDTNTTFYDMTMVKGVFTGNGGGVWYPFAGNWPTVGTGAHQRIGNKIRIKLLRLKGYVSYSPYLINQVRYRIVMYRTQKFPEYAHNGFIVPMYSAFSSIAAANGTDSKQLACTIDYYCAFFNNEYMQSHDIKRRVLFRGIIKPQPDAPNFVLSPVQWTGYIAPDEDEPKIVTSQVVGKHWGNIYSINSSAVVSRTGFFNYDSAPAALENVALGVSSEIQRIPVQITQPLTQYWGEFQRHYTVQGQSASYNASTAGNQRGFFPIDITVHMNDNIDCEKYRYVFVVESDWCIGQLPDGDFGYDEAHANFFISYIPHIYYTDD